MKKYYMKKEPKVFVGHILDSINKILDFTKDRSEVQFSRDDKTQSAVLHQFGIIGEATKNISSDIQLKYSDVVWKIMAVLEIKLFMNILVLIWVLFGKPLKMISLF